MLSNFQSIRQRIDETDTDYQNLVRILYLFGLRVSEISINALSRGRLLKQ